MQKLKRRFNIGGSLTIAGDKNQIAACHVSAAAAVAVAAAADLGKAFGQHECFLAVWHTTKIYGSGVAKPGFQLGQCL